MANDVIVKFRSHLPGGGHQRSGASRQGKTNVRGRIEVTSSTVKGERLTPEMIGLTRIDDLHLTLEEPVTCAAPEAGLTRRVGYSHVAQEFYVWTLNSAGTAATPSSGSSFNLTFDAFGDSAHDVELL